MYDFNMQNSNKMSLSAVQSYREASPSRCSVSQSLVIFTSHTGPPLCQFTDSALCQYLFTSVLTAVMQNKHSLFSFNNKGNRRLFLCHKGYWCFKSVNAESDTECLGASAVLCSGLKSSSSVVLQTQLQKPAVKSAERIWKNISPN